MHAPSLADRLEHLKADLGAIAWTADEATLAAKSRDHFWFSPILKAELEGLTADLVVTPRDRAEVIRVAALCAKHRAPVTARGAGTGTFGQAVPLAGGVVLDMSALDRVCWIKGAAVRAEAGIVLHTLDTACLASGRELRMHPSTHRVATLGGFIAGGHAGIGSVNYGILRDAGNILGIQLVTLEESPRVLEIRGDDIATVHHAYGVNGIITEVELALAPACPWREVVVSFADFMQAARFSWALAVSDGIVKKLVSTFAAALARNFDTLAAYLPTDHHAAFAIVAPEGMEALRSLARLHGGEVTLDRPADAAGQTPLYEFTWGHTTQHALRRDRSVTYLITIFRGASPIGQVQWLHEEYGDAAPLHLEFKRLGGAMAVEGIPVFRFESQAQVERLAAEWEAIGIKVANPHTYYLQNGGMHKIDAAQIAFKRDVDPHGLMNPGKIAGFDQIEGAPGGAAGLQASGWAY